MTLNVQASFELAEGSRRGDSLDLHPVGSSMRVFGLQQQVIQSPLIAQEQKSLRIGIQASQRIDVLGKTKRGERAMTRAIGRKLRNHSVRLVKSEQHSRVVNGGSPRSA